MSASRSPRVWARDLLAGRLGDRCEELHAADLARPALVVAPHFDDETLGCGGTIARKVALGAPVSVLFLFDGSASHGAMMEPSELGEIRRAEARSAAAHLGLAESALIYCDLPDNSPDRDQEAVVELVADAISVLRPAEVYVPHRGDGHLDHACATDAGFEAAATAAVVDEVFEYPVWHWQQWPWVRLSSPARKRGWAPAALHGDAWRRSVDGRFGARFASTLNRVVDVSSTLDQKRSALSRYESQLQRRDPDWPVLGDVSRGDFLSCLQQNQEFFRVQKVGMS